MSPVRNRGRGLKTMFDSIPKFSVKNKMRLGISASASYF